MLAEFVPHHLWDAALHNQTAFRLKLDLFARRNTAVIDVPHHLAQAGERVLNNGRSLLEQAEQSGLSPEFGCRIGICHTCTRRKTSGVVKNLTTGVMSSTEAEDVQICVSVPVGDVDLAL